MNLDEVRYLLSLQQQRGLGPKTIRALIDYCGSAEAIFRLSKKQLLQIPSIGASTVDLIMASRNLLSSADRELELLQKHGARFIPYYTDEYPRRLKQCADFPVLLFGRGEADLNKGKFLSIVGTRALSAYGRAVIPSFVEAFADIDITIVSGLAFGADTAAHKASLEHNIPTIGVMATGLDRIYPDQNRGLAKNMTENGGAILTEYPLNTIPEMGNFPARNRIIAGMADAVLVIESDIKGGSMITAFLAQSYSRDVFAIPGRLNDQYSRGCNLLIKNQVAQLVDEPEDILKAMSWDIDSRQKKTRQLNLFNDLDDHGKELFQLFQEKDEWYIDEFKARLNWSHGKLAEVLLDLEMNGLVSLKPGNSYVKGII